MSFSNSNYSNVVSVTTQPAPVIQLGAPTNLVAVALTPAATDTTDSVKLTWTSNSGGNESGFGIERASDAVPAQIPPAPGPFTQVGTAPKSATSFVDTGLAISTEYWYRVRALA